MTAFDRERRRVERLLSEGQMTKREAERTAQRERHLANARLRYRLKASQEIVWC